MAVSPLLTGLAFAQGQSSQWFVPGQAKLARRRRGAVLVNGTESSRKLANM
jgi:hypothetical protein